MNIKPSEVSSVLLEKLKGIKSDLKYEEVGTVLQVSDGVVRIYGLYNAESEELLEFDNGVKAVVMNLEEDNVGAILLGPTDKIKEGMTVSYEECDPEPSEALPQNIPLDILYQDEDIVIVNKPCGFIVVVCAGQK